MTGFPSKLPSDITPPEEMEFEGSASAWRLYFRGLPPTGEIRPKKQAYEGLQTTAFCLIFGCPLNCTSKSAYKVKKTKNKNSKDFTESCRYCNLTNLWFQKFTITSVRSFHQRSTEKSDKKTALKIQLTTTFT